MKKLLLFGLLLCILFSNTNAQTTDFESFSLGTVNYQGTGGTIITGLGYTIPNPYGSLWTVCDEWGFTGSYDQAVKDDGTGNQVLRLSNAVTSGSTSNQANSPSTLPAGETTSALWNDRGPNHTTPLSPPLFRANATTKYFHGGFKFKSATGASQPGLFISINSAPRQSPVRMSYVAIRDIGTGFNLEFVGTLAGGVFPPTNTIIATNLSYTAWHQVDIYIEFKDGLNGDGTGNDIVTVMLNGSVIHTGTTWETYYAPPVWSATPVPIAVDALTFFARGTAAPGTSGNGLYFDDVTVDNSPVPPTSYNLYLSNSPTVLNGLIFPNDLWPKPWGDNPVNDPVGYPGDGGVDWGFKSALSFFIVPEVGSQFSACDIVVEWDNTMYSYLGLENTGIFNTSPLAFFTQQLGTTTRLYIQASILPGPSTPNFFTITSGQYIAKLNFNSLKVGYGGLSFASIDFRKFDGVGGFQPVYFLENHAKVKNYLGDVVQSTPHDSSTGDGKVNVDDLNSWSWAYWSGVPGYAPGLYYYKAKYDIGPTSTTTVYGMPTTDYKIQFEDLVIFAMSYGLSANGVYPKVAPVPTEPVEVTVGKPIATGNETLVPLFISGAVQDLRAASLSFSGSFGKLISAEKGDLLNSYTTPVMVMSRADGNNVFVDLSIMGADVNGLSEEGQLFVLRFEGKANVNVTTAELRNLANSPMLVKLNGNYKGIPTEFGLSQNYPNPFNPSTMISYQVPVAAMVQIAVFNSIGEKVGTLVNEVKEPGYYEVTWNASAMPSGVYFFRINAGEFTAVKKMMLTK